MLAKPLPFVALKCAFGPVTVTCPVALGSLPINASSQSKVPLERIMLGFWWAPVLSPMIRNCPTDQVRVAPKSKVIVPVWFNIDAPRFPTSDAMVIVPVVIMSFEKVAYILGSVAGTPPTQLAPSVYSPPAGFCQTCARTGLAIEAAAAAAAATAKCENLLAATPVPLRVPLRCFDWLAMLPPFPAS